MGVLSVPVGLPPSGPSPCLIGRIGRWVNRDGGRFRAATWTPWPNLPGIEGLLLEQSWTRRTGSTCRVEQEQRLTKLDRMGIVDKDLDDLAPLLRLDLIHELHGLYDAKDISGGDHLIRLDEGRRAR